MTMTPQELERKVRRLDNEVKSIYELLSTISFTQTRHGGRLDELDRRFDTVDERLAGVDERLTAHDGRFDTIDTKLDEVLTLLRER
jgi:chromosome segregation ATPase